MLGEAAWRQLPCPVQRRFEQQSLPGESVVYHGYVAATQWSAAGRVWAQLLRVAGAPLPLGDMQRATCTVVVAADASGQGQCWTRMYHQPGKLPQVIRSRKLFMGATGLEEPGAIEVRHREERNGLFSFVLTVVHPSHGQVLRQILYFRDAA